MAGFIQEILNKEYLERDDLVALLSTSGEELQMVLERAAAIKAEYVGNKVYYRGLIEYSNICSKNCLYCGIRSGNKKMQRYEMKEEEVLAAARYAYENRFASLVLQSGERSDKVFVDRIEYLLREIKTLGNGALGITLSMGEQTEETFRRWFEAGAHRYLLRIEVSDPELYPKYHPNNRKHEYSARLQNLKLLRKTGYQVGSGVMIGLPFQDMGDLAGDLMFLRDFDIDMVGMGPYIEHKDTPLYKYKDLLLPKQERFELSLKMVALLRIIMKDINIAATTAMQTLDPLGREKAVQAGANVIMPNLTPMHYRDGYLLYEDKPGLDLDAGNCLRELEKNIHDAGGELGFDEWGDSKHFKKRTAKNS